MAGVKSVERGGRRQHEPDTASGRLAGRATRSVVKRVGQLRAAPRRRVLRALLSQGDGHCGAMRLPLTPCRTDANSETLTPKSVNSKHNELLITEEDVMLVRSFVLNDLQNVFDVDLQRFDEDITYKRGIFIKLNPMVHMERCRTNPEMLWSARRRPVAGATDANDKEEHEKNTTKLKELNKTVNRSKQKNEDNVNKTKNKYNIKKSKQINTKTDIKAPCSAPCCREHEGQAAARPLAAGGAGRARRADAIPRPHHAKKHNKVKIR